MGRKDHLHHGKTKENSLVLRLPEHRKTDLLLLSGNDISLAYTLGSGSHQKRFPLILGMHSCFLSLMSANYTSCIYSEIPKGKSRPWVEQVALVWNGEWWLSHQLYKVLWTKLFLKKSHHMHFFFSLFSIFFNSPTSNEQPYLIKCSKNYDFLKIASSSRLMH